MIKSFIVLLCSCVALQGCIVARISQEPAASAKGELCVKVVREESGKLSSDYTLEVRHKGVWRTLPPPGPSGPAVIQDLDPGRYTLVMSSDRLPPQEIRLEVKEGERTTVNFTTENLRGALRMRAAASVTGELLLWVIANVGYLIVLCVIEATKKVAEEAVEQGVKRGVRSVARKLRRD